MPESYKPGQRRPVYGQNHQISENRYAWIQTEGGKFLILVGEDAGHGSDVVVFHPKPGRQPDVTINLTNLTEEELIATRNLFNAAFDWALPVVKRRDKEAADAWENGDDSTPETIDQYRQWCIGRGRSHNTVRAYTSDLNLFLTACETAVEMEEFEELAQSWLNLTRAIASPKTTARRLTALRGFAKWAGISSPLEDYIAPTPGKTIAHPIPEGIAGIERMLDVAKNNEQQALVGFGGFAGLRISETLSMTVDSIRLDDMLLVVRGKGDKTRTVPLSGKAWDSIQSAYVMAHRKSDRRLVSYRDRFARQIVTNLAARAGLQRSVSSHDLRATFATAAHDNGANLRVVQELLGHASSETTEIYTGVHINSMREAVDF